MKTQQHKRTVRKELLFYPTELHTIATAASEAGLNASEWMRYISLIMSKKLLSSQHHKEMR